MATARKFCLVAVWPEPQHRDSRRNRHLYDQFPGNVVDPFSSNLPLLNNFSVGGTTTAANIAPQEKHNVFAAAAASNAALKTGFANGQTLAQIQAAVPGFKAPTIGGADGKNFAPQYQKWSLGIETRVWTKYLD